MYFLHHWEILFHLLQYLAHLKTQPTMGAESLNQQLDLMIRTSVNSRESFELGLVWNYKKLSRLFKFQKHPQLQILLEILQNTEIFVHVLTHQKLVPGCLRICLQKLLSIE